MAKIDGVQEVRIAELVPYERNAKLHSADQVEKIAASIEEFGFLNPILIDGKKNIIAGHGRVKAAEVLGLRKVPCIYVEGLTEAQRRAYILADNRLTELGEWDMPLITAELKELEAMDFDIDLTGFELKADWFESRERYDNNDENESKEYQDFVEKFEPKRTTDDCYTPDLIYEAVRDWVANEYSVDTAKMVRPFYPGGDYQNETYPKDCAVVDNPPFSILSEIVKFYTEKGIRFFLFAPSLTAFGSQSTTDRVTTVAVNASITYENGAVVATSFVTNMDGADIQARTATDLYRKITKADEEIKAQQRTPVRKYSYPDEVVTSAMLGKYCKYGVDLTIKRKDCVRISALDAQKETGDAIFGGGLLLSQKAAAEKAAAEKAAAEKAAAEKAAAERWTLSERERQIVSELGE